MGRRYWIHRIKSINSHTHISIEPFIDCIWYGKVFPIWTDKTSSQNIPTQWAHIFIIYWFAILKFDVWGKNFLHWTRLLYYLCPARNEQHVYNLPALGTHEKYWSCYPNWISAACISFSVPCFFFDQRCKTDVDCKRYRLLSCEISLISHCTLFHALYVRRIQNQQKGQWIQTTSMETGNLVKCNIPWMRTSMCSCSNGVL